MYSKSSFFRCLSGSNKGIKILRSFAANEASESTHFHFVAREDTYTNGDLIAIKGSKLNQVWERLAPDHVALGMTYFDLDLKRRSIRPLGHWGFDEAGVDSRSTSPSYSFATPKGYFWFSAFTDIAFAPNHFAVLHYQGLLLLYRRKPPEVYRSLWLSTTEPKVVILNGLYSSRKLKEYGGFDNGFGSVIYREKHNDFVVAAAHHRSVATCTIDFSNCDYHPTYHHDEPLRGQTYHTYFHYIAKIVWIEYKATIVLLTHDAITMFYCDQETGKIYASKLWITDSTHWFLDIQSVDDDVYDRYTRLNTDELLISRGELELFTYRIDVLEPPPDFIPFDHVCTRYLGKNEAGGHIHSCAAHCVVHFWRYQGNHYAVTSDKCGKPIHESRYCDSQIHVLKFGKMSIYPHRSIDAC